MLRPLETPQMVAGLTWSLPEDSQGIIFSSSLFQGEMEKGSTIQLESRKTSKQCFRLQPGLRTHKKWFEIFFIWVQFVSAPTCLV